MLGVANHVIGAHDHDRKPCAVQGLVTSMIVVYMNCE
jgi:hypothetical protein